MRVFVYEYFTALGIGHDPNSPEHGIYREGLAMRDAVAEDFRHLPNTEVVFATMPATPEAEEAEFHRLASNADYTLLIAPETGGCLHLRRQWAANTPTIPISSALEGIVLTGDKQGLGHWWQRQGVRTPRTAAFSTRWQSFPVVLKPVHGAGSQATFLIRNTAELTTAAQSFLAAGFAEDEMMFQEFAPGQAASVAFLCGLGGNVPLLPAFQHISRDGRFQYEGGELPIRDDLAARVVRVAQQAVDCVPGLLGYVGVDVVLGPADDGSQDAALEINPRLTTSYVGLRALADFNLAGAMLGVALGKEVGLPGWKPARVRFAADGLVVATLAGR